MYVTEFIRTRSKEDWGNNVTSNRLFVCNHHYVWISYKQMCSKNKRYSFRFQ